MTLRLGNIFLIIVLLLAMLMGCDRAEKVSNTAPAPTTDDPMPETPEAIRVKSV